MKPMSPAPKLVLAAAIYLVTTSQSPAPNVVGYVNVPVSANRYHLVANPLSATNNVLNTVIPTMPDGSKAWIWNITDQTFLGPSVYSSSSGNWTINYPVSVGRGFMLCSPVNYTNTFIGEVMQGTLINPVAGTNKLSLLGSMVPMVGGLASVHQFPVSDGDTVFKYASLNHQYQSADMYHSGYGWFTNEPNLGVAEGFFIRHPGPSINWIRNFTVSFASSPSPSWIKGYSIRNGVVTLEINEATKPYNVQFSTDRVNWTDIAVNQTNATWQSTLPSGSAGFFQVILP